MNSPSKYMNFYMHLRCTLVNVECTLDYCKIHIYVFQIRKLLIKFKCVWQLTSVVGNFQIILNLKYTLDCYIMHA